MVPVLAFDIETIPDCDGLRRVHGLSLELSDAQVAEFAFERRREQTAGASDFLPLHQHRVAAIACLFRDDRGLKVRALGAAGDPEERLLQDFFRVIERHTPQLVSWNGGGFDLPVLHYRGLVHGVRAERYWDQGENDRDFRWNNYISRYHARHVDLMDLLALYSPRASAPLDDLARLCGFPGKVGMDGSRVWDAHRDGRIDEIRAYCETDAVNTYLLFTRFQLMRGALSQQAYAQEIALVRETVGALDGAHWRAFLDAWPQ
ncbi:MAG: 3'-5' exonuclease [Burkholderiales bacterium]|nr:MAG: 3'-5' exonuclease [Burkholderiales bacterium]